MEWVAGMGAAIRNFDVPETNGRIAAGEFAKEMTDEELAAWMQDYLVKDGSIFKTPVRSKNNILYYFDEEMIYREDFTGTKLRGYSNLFRPNEVSEVFDFNVWSRAKIGFRPGMALNECLLVYINTQI